MQTSPLHLQQAEAAALAYRAGLHDGAEAGQSVVWKPALLAGELVDEFRTVAVVLAHVVIVDGLLDEPPGVDERIDGRSCGVGHGEEWLAVDLANDLAVDFDGRVGPDHL